MHSLERRWAREGLAHRMGDAEEPSLSRFASKFGVSPKRAISGMVDLYGGQAVLDAVAHDWTEQLARVACEWEERVGGSVFTISRAALATTKVDRDDLSGTGPEVVEYLRGLRPGEKVIETGQSGMQGAVGEVYTNGDGVTCVKWDIGGGRWMGTSVTWGSRRIVFGP